MNNYIYTELRNCYGHTILSNLKYFYKSCVGIVNKKNITCI